MKYYMDIKLLNNAEIPINFIWEKLYHKLHLSIIEHFNKELKNNNKLKDLKKKNKCSQISFAFPEYEKLDNKNNTNPTLGNTLRIFMEKQNDLEKYKITAKDLNIFYDYIQFSYKEPKKIKNNINKFVAFCRVQIKYNVEKIARRRAKRIIEGKCKIENKNLNSLSYENAYKQSIKYLSSCKKSSDLFSGLPFININSVSSGRKFRLFIAKLEKTEEDLRKSKNKSKVIKHNNEENSYKFNSYGLSNKLGEPIESENLINNIEFLPQF